MQKEQTENNFDLTELENLIHKIDAIEKESKESKKQSDICFLSTSTENSLIAVSRFNTSQSQTFNVGYNAGIEAARRPQQKKRDITREQVDAYNEAYAAAILGAEEERQNHKRQKRHNP